MFWEDYISVSVPVPDKSRPNRVLKVQASLAAQDILLRRRFYDPIVPKAPGLVVSEFKDVSG